ncbi:MAG: transcription antitermination factor NusB [Candidatus Electrothrix sp. AR3]|nr:transcription antitermination factor NusB [Candidatus Electrothrix sp. AR3]
MGLRRKSRELALQFLFGHDFQDRSSEEAVLQAELEEFYDCFKADDKALPYARQLIAGICIHQDDIDRRLSTCSHNWRVERMALVDRNILRIAAYEIVHVQDVPATVAINEALEIAKRYAEPDAIGFINGVLDGLQEK